MRQRERERERVCVCVCVYVCAHMWRRLSAEFEVIFAVHILIVKYISPFAVQIFGSMHRLSSFEGNKDNFI